jgi:hypothetical protein
MPRTIQVFGLLSLLLFSCLVPLAKAQSVESDCSPKGVDVCRMARQHAEASRKMPLFNDTEGLLAAGSPAFESPSAVGREYRQDIIMPFPSSVRANINKDQNFAHAVVASDMHRLGRTAFCEGHVALIGKGGAVRATYYFRDRVKITEVFITDCSMGGVTWDAKDMDPCAPYGFDICNLVDAFAKKQNALLASKKRDTGAAAGSKDEDTDEISAIDTDHATVIIVFRERRTTSELFGEDKNPDLRRSYENYHRREAIFMSCREPTSEFIKYGGSTVSRFLSADGNLLFEYKVSFCEKDSRGDTPSR